MKTILYTSESDFYNDLEHYNLDMCHKCRGIMEISMEHIIVNIADRFMDIEEIPMLKCKICGELYYTYYAQIILSGLYEELKIRGNKGVNCTPINYQKRYDYANEKNFIYDYRDYESIPGLMFDDEHSKEGFLTPVYFDRKALLYFMADPDYEVDIFSESYGHFGKKDPEGIYRYEWAVPFGFNTNGKLVFWLGDIDTMDDMTQSILRNFNVESDHLLIDSEFYRAQMLCVPSEPIKEKQIVINKKSFIKNIQKKYGIDISHLENECLTQEDNIKRPIVFNENNISGVINALDKILVEGFNVSGLKSLYEILYDSDSREKGYTKWQSIRLIKETLKKLGEELFEENEVKKIIAPLYILHDYRIYFDHLLSENEQEKLKTHIAETLGVEKFSDQEKLYFKEIKGLDQLFKYLVILSK